MSGFRAIVIGCALLAAVVQAQQPPDAAQVLASAREALGGEKKLAAVTSFVATGQTRQVRGNNLVPIQFEINAELPGQFVRKDEIPAQDGDISVAGFNGDMLVQFPAPPATAAAQRLITVKQDFARLMLGAFAASFPSYPLTFKYVAVGEAPEGKADVLAVAGPDNFAAQLVIAQGTHLPVVLMWQQPAGPPGQAKPADYRLYYGDYRDVNGIKWPFRIRRAIAGDTVEATTFDRVRVNVKIDPKKFEPPK